MTIDMDVMESKYSCQLACVCPDVKKLKKGLDRGVVEQDLFDQYQELCAVNAKGGYCMIKGRLKERGFLA
jgi:hypothetical protein